MNAKISVTCYKSKILSNGEAPLIVLKIGIHTQMLAPFVWWPYTNISI